MQHALVILLSEGKNAQCLQKEQEKHDGSNNLDHNGIESLAAELETAESDLVNNGLGLDDPANKDAACDCNNRHKDVVADIVENVENLCNATVGKGHLEVEDIVAEADDYANNIGDDGSNKSCLFAAPAKFIHAAGNNGFQKGNRRGESGKCNSNEEDNSDNGACTAHCVKYLGEGDEHKAGACGHAFGAHKGEHGGNDHETCKESNESIEDFNAVNALNKVGVLLDIGTIGNHDAHCNGDGIEKLTHCVGEDNKEFLEGHSLEIGNNINKKSLQTGAGNTLGIGVLQGEGEDGNTNYKDEKYGHQYLGKTLNAAVNALIDNEDIGCNENGEPNKGTPGGGDEAGEETVCNSVLAGEGDVSCKILQNPSADCAVVGKDHGGYYAGDNADPAHLLTEHTVGGEGALAGFASDCDFGCEKCKAECDNQNKVNKQKYTAAVLCGEIGEAPYVTQTDCTAGCGKNESQRTGESASCRFIFHNILLFL